MAWNSISASYLQFYSTLRTSMYRSGKKRCPAGRTHPDGSGNFSMWPGPRYEVSHRCSVSHGTWRGRTVYKYGVSRQQLSLWLSLATRPHHVILYYAPFQTRNLSNWRTSFRIVTADMYSMRVGTLHWYTEVHPTMNYWYRIQTQDRSLTQGIAAVVNGVRRSSYEHRFMTDSSLALQMGLGLGGTVGGWINDQYDQLDSSCQNEWNIHAFAPGLDGDMRFCSNSPSSYYGS